MVLSWKSFPRKRESILAWNRSRVLARDDIILKRFDSFRQSQILSDIPSATVFAVHDPTVICYREDDRHHVQTVQEGIVVERGRRCQHAPE